MITRTHLNLRQQGGRFPDLADARTSVLPHRTTLNEPSPTAHFGSRPRLRPGATRGPTLEATERLSAYHRQPPPSHPAQAEEPSADPRSFAGKDAV